MTCACFLLGPQTMSLIGEKKEQESQHCVTSVSLSFLIASKGLLWTLSDWPPCITRCSQLPPKAAKSPSERACRGPRVHAASHVYICPLSTPTGGHPGCAPTVLCLGRCSLLVVVSSSLTDNVFHLAVGETACSPFCCRDAPGQRLALVARASSSMDVSSRDQRYPFSPGAVSNAFPPLDGV